MMKPGYTVARIGIWLVYAIANRLSSLWRRFLKTPFDSAYLRYHGVEAPYGQVHLDGLPIIRRHHGSRIVIGRGVTLTSRPQTNPAGICHPVTLATLAPGAVIVIDEGSGLSGATVCSAKAVCIGKHVGIGANSIIYDTDFHVPGFCEEYSDAKDKARSSPVIISDYAWVGANAMILKGVLLEEACVVGAGAVIRKRVPAGATVYGNPAIAVRQ